MTKEHVYAYESGYQDGLKAAEAENAELRMRITSLEAALEGMHLIREQDMAENAKLREAFAAALIRVSAANEETGHYMDEDFCNMLRELGIEVE